MCGKQCRDENGFKCHLTSESHKRQMEVFGQNPHRIIDGFSEEFENNFMDHMRRSHPFTRISANVVYNEIIADRHHIHMNSTKWLTLTEFVKYLGREGKCKVEDTPKGWFITLIHKDQKDDIEGKKKKRREREEEEEEDRQRRALELQIERAKKAARIEEGDEEYVDHQFKPEILEEPLVLSLGGGGKQTSTKRDTEDTSRRGDVVGGRDAKGMKIAATAVFDDDDTIDLQNSHAYLKKKGTKMSKLEELMERDAKAKQQSHLKSLGERADTPDATPAKNDGHRSTLPWLYKGMYVKIISKALKEYGYYQKKGKLLCVIDSFIGEIEMLDSGDIIRVDQAELETVIPQPGGRIMVVRGKYKGQTGVLISIDEANYKAKIRVHGSDVVCDMEYDDFSRMSSSS